MGRSDIVLRIIELGMPYGSQRDEMVCRPSGEVNLYVEVNSCQRLACLAGYRTTILFLPSYVIKDLNTRVPNITKIVFCLKTIASPSLCK